MATPITHGAVRAAPKVLLHDHLDGGLRPTTVLELADDVILISKLRWTKRVHAEVTRDLLTRAGVEPTGLLVIGEGSHAPYPYYR